MAFWPAAGERDGPGPDARAERGEKLRFGEFFDVRREWMSEPEEAISYTVTSVRMNDEESGASRNYSFTLGIVNNTNRIVEGTYPEVRCSNGEENHVVLAPDEIEGGNYPSGLESGTGTLGQTMEIGCGFSEPTHPEDLSVTVTSEGDSATFVDPMSSVDRVKRRHDLDS